MQTQKRGITRSWPDPSRVGLPSKGLVDWEMYGSNTVWHYKFPNGHAAMVICFEGSGMFHAGMLCTDDSTRIIDNSPYSGTEISKVRALIREVRRLPRKEPGELHGLAPGMTIGELLGNSYRRR